MRNEKIHFQDNFHGIFPPFDLTFARENIRKKFAANRKAILPQDGVDKILF